MQPTIRLRIMSGLLAVLASFALRAALTGTNVSPGIFDVLAVLGREESLGRMADCL